MMRFYTKWANIN